MKQLLALALISSLLVFVGGVTVGQELERTSGESTGWWWYSNASVGALAAAFDEHGARLIDLEVTSVSPLRFSACLVRNSGSYASGWWWYFGIDADRVSELLDELSARIIDLEVYSVRGQLRFAVILVPNTGSQAKAWWWLYNASAETLSDLVSQHNARLVDLEVYEHSGRQRYAAVMIRNTGDDEDSWSWHIGISPDDLSALFSSNPVRILDLERMPDGRYAAILFRRHGEPWWWWYGLRSSDVTEVAGITGGRIVDVEQYTYGGDPRYLVVMTGDVDETAPTVTESPVSEIYPVRIVLSTTSDWTDVRFVGGTIAIQAQAILEGVGADGLQVAAQSTISISQDCCDTVPVRVSFDAYLSDPAEWLQMEVEKGHVGQTTVSLYSRGESDLIDTYIHIGVAENPDSTNTRTFWIHSPYLTSILPRVLASPSE
ncbi:hypothetical protein ACFLSG_01930 [Candidatus Bipolaricaulota bacterium]